MHLVMRGYLRSRDKDGGHTIRSAIAKPHSIRQLRGSVFYRIGVMATGSFTVRDFFTFHAAET